MRCALRISTTYCFSPLVIAGSSPRCEMTTHPAGEPGAVLDSRTDRQATNTKARWLPGATTGWLQPGAARRRHQPLVPLARSQGRLAKRAWRLARSSRVRTQERLALGRRHPLFLGARSERLAPRRRLPLCAHSGRLALRRRHSSFLSARSERLAPRRRRDYVYALCASRAERAALLTARCSCRLAANGLPATASRWHGTCGTVGRDLWDLWAFPSAAEAAER